MKTTIKAGQMRVKLNEVVALLEAGIDGNSSPFCLMRRDSTGDFFHGVYQSDLDVLSEGDQFEVWLNI